MLIKPLFIGDNMKGDTCVAVYSSPDITPYIISFDVRVRTDGAVSRGHAFEPKGRDLLMVLLLILGVGPRPNINMWLNI